MKFPSGSNELIFKIQECGQNNGHNEAKEIKGSFKKFLNGI